MPVTVELQDETLEWIKRAIDDCGTSSYAGKALRAIVKDLDRAPCPGAGADGHCRVCDISPGRPDDTCPCGDPGDRDRRHFPVGDGRICTSYSRVDL